MTDSIDKRIEAAEKRLKEAAEKTKKLRTERARKLARQAAEAAKQERAKDTRRKVLIGAFVMQQHGADVTGLELGGKRFLDWLTRDDDKALFSQPGEGQ